jgi:hypothetical protein
MSYLDGRIALQLISRDWLEGLEIWCNSHGSNSTSFPRKRDVGTRGTGKDKELIRAAATKPAGDQQLIYFWNSRVLPYTEQVDGWASKTLRYVATSSCSITLARYLLEKGANINARQSIVCCTALQLAARKTSAEGAEMMRFLLLNGADPKADQIKTKSQDKKIIRLLPGKKIRDEDGAKGIHRWLGKTWDELIKEIQHIRNTKEVVS